jgi:hypothetical protein
MVRIQKTHFSCAKRIYANSAAVWVESSNGVVFQASGSAYQEVMSCTVNRGANNAECSFSNKVGPSVFTGTFEPTAIPVLATLSWVFFLIFFEFGTRHLMLMNDADGRTLQSFSDGIYQHEPRKQFELHSFPIFCRCQRGKFHSCSFW